MRTLIAGVALLATMASASAECWQQGPYQLFIQGGQIIGDDWMICDIDAWVKSGRSRVFSTKCYYEGTVDQPPDKVVFQIDRNSDGTAMIRSEGVEPSLFEQCRKDRTS